jgi:hypothetical protein
MTTISFQIFKSVHSAQFIKGLFDSKFSAGKLLQHVEVGGRACEILIERCSDSVEAILHSGIADAKDALHFFQGAVVADESDDKSLIIGAEFAERGDLEIAIESEFAGGASETGDV